MNRRNWLRKLGGSVGLSVGIAAVAKSDPDYNQTFGQFRYKGWAFGWTGWKPAYTNLSLVGQWVGYNIKSRKEGKPKYIFSSVPGASGRYNPGDEFNITYQEWQKMHADRVTWMIANNIGPERWEEVLASDKEKAKQVLLDLIDTL